jgi:putative intracellular protease/amidase
MKKIILALMLMIVLPSFTKEKLKVLLFIQDNSMDLGYMLTNEVGTMKQILEQSGFIVEIATISGETLKTESMTIKPDLKLSEVEISKYSGFMIPCMAANDTIVTPDEKSFVRKIVNNNKPLAAQTGGVFILAKAGVLKGKKFAMETGLIELIPEFKNGIFSGAGVVQDGNIITSGTCPMMAKTYGAKDGTPELTNNLVKVIQEQN